MSRIETVHFASGLMFRMDLTDKDPADVEGLLLCYIDGLNDDELDDDVAEEPECKAAWDEGKAFREHAEERDAEVRRHAAQIRRTVS